MAEPTSDKGVIAVLLDRFANDRLPRTIALKKRMDEGHRLGEWEIAFLEDVLEDANRVMPLVDRHPEYQELAAKAIGLYQQITEQALENEKAKKPSSY